MIKERRAYYRARCERECEAQTIAFGKIMGFTGIALSLILSFGNQLVNDMWALQYFGYGCSIISLICIQGLTVFDVGISFILESF